MLRERRAARPCVVCGEAPARPFVRGPLCTLHAPEQPARVPSLVPSPSASLPPREYGDATTDPLGREGPGWAVAEASRLPVRRRAEP